MNNVITVTFDGQVLKPKINLNLEINKEYQIQLINLQTKSPTNDLEISAQLYAEIYQEDEDIQELTETSCIDFLA